MIAIEPEAVQSFSRPAIALICAAAFSAVTFIGCGGGNDITLVKAGGLVTFNGEPLAGANVTFLPEKGPAATGQTGPDGRFQLKTGTREGVMPAKCTVMIVGPPQEGPAADTANMKPEDLEDLINALSDLEVDVDGKTKVRVFAE